MKDSADTPSGSNFVSRMNTTARNWLGAVAAGREADPKDLRDLRVGLGRVARRKFPTLDPDDLVQETMTRIEAGRGRQSPKPVKHPWAFLVTTLSNLAIDEIRRSGRRNEVRLDDLAIADGDHFAAVIDRLATIQEVSAAMAALLELGDLLTVRIVTEWIDIAEESGHAPGSREVAERVGVSHTSVGKALASFRAFLRSEP